MGFNKLAHQETDAIKSTPDLPNRPEPPIKYELEHTVFKESTLNISVEHKMLSSRLEF